MSDTSATVLPEEARLPDDVFYRHWRAQEPLRAVVLLVHGMGEHSGRYQAVAEYLCARGIAVVAPDHLGHGVSPGRRAHLTHFTEYLQPLEQLRDMIDRWYPNTPCFLLGHSLGGLIATRFLLQNQQRYTGAILSGAALQPAEPPAKWLLWLIKVLASVAPRLGVMKLDASEVSRDPEVVARYSEDPLIHHGRITAQLVNELFTTMAVVVERSEELTLPLLILHGAEDVMAAPAGSEELYAAVAATDKKLIVYPGLFHEIFNEPERLDVLADVERWISAHLAGHADA